MIDYDKYLNDHIKTVKPSGIRKFFDIANEMDDVISLSIGEPDFQTPWHIRDEGIKSLETLINKISQSSLAVTSIISGSL